MGTVTTTIHGVIIGVNGIETVVVIADQISTERNETVRTEATTQSRVLVVDTGVNNSDLDTMSCDTLLAQLINLSHDVRRESISSIINSSLRKRSLHARLSSPLNTRSRNTVDLDRPDILDDGEASHLGSQILSRGDIIELDGNALEEIVVEFDTRGRLVISLFVEERSILTLLELKDVSTGKVSHGALFRLGRLRKLILSKRQPCEKQSCKS